MATIPDRLIEILKKNDGVVTHEELAKRVSIKERNVRQNISRARKMCNHIYTCRGVGYVYCEEGDPYTVTL